MLPYGCRIIEDNLRYVFPENTIQYSSRTIYETLKDTLKKPGVYLFINDTYEPDEFDMNRLMKFIRGGGTVFVSAFVFSDEFEKAAEIFFKNYYQGSHWDSIKFETSEFTNYGGYPASKYIYPGVSLDERTDLSRIEIYARNNLNEPVYFSKKYGEGKLFVHLFPIGFTNYYMTEKEAADFAFKSMAFLPEKSIVWDEYYKTGKIMIQTPLRYILSEPHLSWAYYLLLFAAFLFIFFYGKREQRIIPVIKPFANTSMEYYKRIALLRKHQFRDKNYIRVLFESFSSRVTAHFRMTGNIFMEKNEALVKTENFQAGLLYMQIEKEFEKLKNIEKPRDQIKSLILKIDNFYKLTGIYAKRRSRI